MSDGGKNDFEREIEALLFATLEQQPAWHAMDDLPGDERLPPEVRLAVLEARVNAYRAIIMRLAREIGERGD